MSETLTLKYSLAELPSSQHRAGLAGLVLMIRWMQRQPNPQGVFEIKQIDETSATVVLDREGLQYLFDHVYAASAEERAETKLRKKKTTREIITPIWEAEQMVEDKSGNSKATTFYYYLQVVPKGAFLKEYDRSEGGLWVKLWRSMMWSILRGVPATRRPFEERSEGEFKDDADKAWKDLHKAKDAPVDLPSTYFIGAQASNAEDVPFKDVAKFQFLLHFWCFVAQIYVPMTWSYDRKTDRDTPKDAGYALVIPDIADLSTFCDEFPEVLKSRDIQASGYRPKQCVIDLPAEGALDLMSKLNTRLANAVNIRIEDLLLGIDVMHLEKQGNNIRLWGSSRIDPSRQIIDDYLRIKERSGNKTFRKQRLLNVLNHAEWFHGFDSLLSKTDSKQTIGNSSFRSDVRKAFEDVGIANLSRGENNMDAATKENVPKSVDEIVYRLVGTYISAKLKSKHQLEWSEGIKGTSKEAEYNEKKSKVAREVFLAIRSRTESDFIDYFASTLCAFPQFLNEESYGTLAMALHQETDKVRTLTMLALSARG